MQTKIWGKKYHAVAGEIDKNRADFGEAAASLLLMKLILRNKTHDYNVHKETVFFRGNLGGHHSNPAILLTSHSVISSKWSKVNVSKSPGHDIIRNFGFFQTK